jgi:hypothetical protein
MLIKAPIVLITAALLASSVGQAQSKAMTEGAALDTRRAEPGVVWEGAGSTPRFIPGSALFTTEGKLNREWFRHGGLEDLERRVDRARLRQDSDPSNPCLVSGGTEQGLVPQPVQDSDWISRIQRTDVTATGHVVSVISGLDPSTLLPVSLVSVAIDATLRSARGTPTTESVVTYVSRNGELTINGTRYCAQDPEEQQVRVGDSVVISGWVVGKRLSHLANRPAHDVLPVTSNAMVSVKSPESKGARAIPLKRFIQEIKADRGGTK